MIASPRGTLARLAPGDPMSALIPISRRLARDTAHLHFAPPVACVYRPLLYAREPHERYLERWGDGPRELLFLGMNPGPFGMMQTGVPFGEVAAVRDWLRITGRVERPEAEHLRRPVLGFATTRSEVSGARLWGWARQRWGSPERFFARAFVWNWCPLGFLAASGANLTPDKLPRTERLELESVCDRALGEVVDALATRTLIAVGGFAERAIRRALGARLPVVRLPHPSPASPAANRGWAAQADAALAAAGLDWT